MSPLNITQPLGIWSIMATIRWCSIFPKWDSYQPLSMGKKHHWNISPSWVQGALPRSQASSMTSISEPSELSSESSLSPPDSESCDECSSSWEHVAGLNQQMEMLWGAHGDLMGAHGNIYGDIDGYCISLSPSPSQQVRLTKSVRGE